MSIWTEIMELGIPFDNHESDLYIPDTPETRAIVTRHGHSFEPFVSQIDGKRWLDVPFAYEPWWERRTGRANPRPSHTPGPWVISKMDGYIYQEHPTLKGEPKYHDKRIADVYNSANSRLIAAAPELLEALDTIAQKEPKSILAEAAYSGGDLPKKWMAEHGAFCDGYNKALNECQELVQQAIAKAKGRR